LREGDGICGKAKSTAEADAAVEFPSASTMAAESATGDNRFLESSRRSHSRERFHTVGSDPPHARLDSTV
jgi:hypothetical protein